MLREHINNLENKIDTKSNNLKNSNRYKHYFLADGIYNSEKNFTFLKQRGYIPIMNNNKRNSHKEPIEMISKEKLIYNKRIIVENLFAKLKQYRRIGLLYEKKMSIYNSFLHLGLSLILFKKLQNPQ